MLKIAVIGVMAVFLAIPLQKEKAEFGMLVIMAACLLLLSLSLGKMREVVDIVHRVEEYLGNSSMYVGILLKIIGITYVAEFGANLCNDAGYGAVANQIEFYGKLMILAVSIPILMTLIETIGSL
ncbi:stage III sporulation protein AD [bacterium 1xD8-6]|nr:stage III sporulation protein AD [bacterium D16-36]RKI73182.1 stage III sporulation protein AD [bacterium 1xD8-6]